MKVIVIGAGLIGCERIEALQKLSTLTNGLVELAAVVEPNPELRQKIASKYGVATLTSFEDIDEKDVDWAIVCTPHHLAAGIISQCFSAGYHVIVEKPLGRSLVECDAIIASKPENLQLKVGFNYRFYEGINAIITDAKNGVFGELISVNMILAHGNSPGMENSWKLDPVKCGGGCLIDPGVHLLDLALVISQGEMDVRGGVKWSGFWNTGIEEESHLILTDSTDTCFNLQVSLNRWRSAFRLEVNGTNGYGRVEGRGKSYGPQSYVKGERWGWREGKSQADSEITVIDANNGSESFFFETRAALKIDDANNAGTRGRFTLPACDYTEARRVMKLLDQCRQSVGI